MSTATIIKLIIIAFELIGVGTLTALIFNAFTPATLRIELELLILAVLVRILPAPRVRRHRVRTPRRITEVMA